MALVGLDSLAGGWPRRVRWIEWSRQRSHAEANAFLFQSRPARHMPSSTVSELCAGAGVEGPTLALPPSGMVARGLGLCVPSRGCRATWLPSVAFLRDCW